MIREDKENSDSSGSARSGSNGSRKELPVSAGLPKKPDEVARGIGNGNANRENVRSDVLRPMPAARRRSAAARSSASMTVEDLFGIIPEEGESKSSTKEQSARKGAGEGTDKKEEDTDSFLRSLGILPSRPQQSAQSAFTVVQPQAEIKADSPVVSRTENTNAKQRREDHSGSSSSSGSERSKKSERQMTYDAEVQPKRREERLGSQSSVEAEEKNSEEGGSVSPSSTRFSVKSQLRQKTLAAGTDSDNHGTAKTEEADQPDVALGLAASSEKPEPLLPVSGDVPLSNRTKTLSTVPSDHAASENHLKEDELDFEQAASLSSKDADQPLSNSISLRSAAYKEWLRRKKEQQKQTLAKQKQKEEEQLRKQELRNARLESAESSYASWKQQREQLLKEKHQQQLQAQKKKLEEEEEKFVTKQKDAVSMFQAWKMEKDAKLADARRLNREKHQESSAQKAEEERRKREDSVKMFEAWKKIKHEQIQNTIKEYRERKQRKAEIQQEEKATRETTALLAFESWIQMKEQRKLEEYLINVGTIEPERASAFTPPPWLPPNRTVARCPSQSGIRRAR